MDASRPTGLRFAGFVLAISGASLLAAGAVTTWVTVGLRAVPNNIDTAIPGVDLTDGKVVLACAGVVLAATMGARLLRGRAARMGFSVVVIAAGMIGAVVAGAFLQNGIDRSVVLVALATPRDQWQEFGAFREYGIGPYLALGGGVLGFCSGILTLAWAQRLAPAPAPRQAS
jgi:hypothetical protein